MRGRSRQHTLKNTAPDWLMFVWCCPFEADVKCGYLTSLWYNHVLCFFFYFWHSVLTLSCRSLLPLKHCLIQTILGAFLETAINPVSSVCLRLVIMCPNFDLNFFIIVDVAWNHFTVDFKIRWHTNLSHSSVYWLAFIAFTFYSYCRFLFPI